MRHEFEVIRLWEQPTQPFLESTGLLPLAVLTDTPNRAQTLRRVAECIENVPDVRVQSNVAASTGILAGLTLEKSFINQVLRKEIMQQSVIYQEWKEELEQSGETRLVLRQLTRRVGDVSSEMRSQIQALSLKQLEALGEALLDFSDPVDLVNWLQNNQAESAVPDSQGFRKECATGVTSINDSSIFSNKGCSSLKARQVNAGLFCAF